MFLWREPGLTVAILSSMSFVFALKNRPFRIRVMDMVFNATFNNISVISWQSVLLVKVTGVSGENHQPVASH